MLVAGVTETSAKCRLPPFLAVIFIIRYFSASTFRVPKFFALFCAGVIEIL